MKKVEQVKKNGKVVLDFDQPLRKQEDIYNLLNRIFDGQVEREKRQFVLRKKMAFLAASITYLGHPWPISKKRIQLKDYYIETVSSNLERGLETFFLGIYHYLDNYIFALFDPDEFFKNKVHNSSAHIQTFDLQYTALEGSYLKTDKKGHRIQLLRLDYFKNYISSRLAGIAVAYDGIADNIIRYFSNFEDYIPKRWVGIDCMKEMQKAGDNNYRQGEWAGFYFEFLVKQYLESDADGPLSWFSKKESGELDFDLKYKASDWVYLDLKAERDRSDVLGNDLESIDKVVSHGGRLFYICLLYDVEKDSDHDYVTSLYWNSLRDDPYQNLDELKSRYGKKMKFAVNIKSLKILNIDKTSFGLLSERPFNQGVNSDGRPRKPKLKVSRSYIDAIALYQKEIS